MLNPDSGPVVAFTSGYGSTARYAHGLADRLHCPALDLDTSRQVPSRRRLADRTVVVLAPVYGRRLRRHRVVDRLLDAVSGPVALAVVGLSGVEDPERETVVAPVRERTGATVQVFHLRGDYDPDALGPWHRLLMARMRTRLRWHPEERGTAEILSGRRCEFVDPATLDPIVEWVRRA